MIVDLIKRKMRETYVRIQIEGFKYQVTKSKFPCDFLHALENVRYYTLLNSEKSFLILIVLLGTQRRFFSNQSKIKNLTFGLSCPFRNAKW